MTQEYAEPSEPPTGLEENASIFVSALTSLTDGMQNLFRSHFNLARYEIKSDAIGMGKDAGAVVVALVFALIGYLLLLVSAIIFAGWFAGIVGMGICSMTLCLIHLVGGALVVRGVVAQFKARHYGLYYTGDELERSKKWVKQLPQQV